MKLQQNKKFGNIEQIQEGFEEAGYVCSLRIATTLYLAYHLEKPILVEGPAGVGKTELAKMAATYLDVPLIRLQCYEGLDESKALYEWKYGKQLLYTQILKDKLSDVLKGAEGLSDSMSKLHQYDDIFFSNHFLEPRPLLNAIRQKEGAVLLVDEVDKSDQEFEAFLLEILSDFQVSVPEIGTIKALSKPFVFLTSNNTREMSEALKRRCLHLFIPFPDPKLEREIIRVQVPDLSEDLRARLVSFIQQVRNLDLKKLPSVSETIDWAKVLVLLHSSQLDQDLIRDTLNVFLKFEEDIDVVLERLYDLAEKELK
ncbi:MAG: MoxR family ATPase, partial [Deltaproteobacteria bacterium]|nr:MoxR family ATPase [Deltaproteobacteria bacterium]